MKSLRTLGLVAVISLVGAPVALAQTTTSVSDASAAVAVTGTTAAADASLSETAPAAAPAAGAVDEPADPLPWGLRHRRYSNQYGNAGSLLLSDPSSGAPGSVRTQLVLDTYAGSDYLYDGDEVEVNTQRLSLSVTATEFLELYMAFENFAAFSNLPSTNSYTTLGDMLFGVKAWVKITPVLSFGGDIELGIMNDAGSTSDSVLDATNVGLRTALSINLQGLEKPVPFITRFNLGYLFDNSAKTIDDIEDARYESLGASAMAKENEVRHLVNRVERLGFAVNRVDRLNIGVGLEAPFEVADDFYLHPLVDYQVGIPINRQGYDCPFFSSDEDRGTPASTDDTCLDDAGGKAYPMNIAIGVRVVPPVRGLSALLAVDFGLTGTDVFVRELEPNLPYRLVLGLGYDFDARPPEKVIVEKPVEVAAPAPVVGRLSGKVVADGSAEPVAGAAVEVVGQGLTAQATGADGAFLSYELAPGQINLNVSHPDYEPGSCSALIPDAGGEVPVQCTLVALPRTGTLRGRLVDSYGAPVTGARVQLTGPSSPDVRIDPAGAFEQAGLPEGSYRVRVESDGHLLKLGSFSISPRQTTQLELSLLPKPAKPSVSVKGGAINAPLVKFAGDATEPDAPASAQLAEVADLLLRSPEIRRVRIEGSGDDALALTRALMIKQRLVDLGVEETRLEATGGSGGARVKMLIVND